MQPPREPVRLIDLVGETPLIELPRLSPKPGVRLFAKLEGLNPSGSIKDRIAKALVEAAEARGDLAPGDTLVEATSGNTGIALAVIGRQKGYPVHLFVPESVPSTIGDTLEVLGAQITWCPDEAGLRGAIERAEAVAAQPGHWMARQFDDPLNVETHYRTTGAEIVDALPSVCALVAGIGTGGTLMGVGRRVREACPDALLVGVEPRFGDKLQGLQCIEEAFAPPLLDLTLLSRRILVDNATALNAARKVAGVEGLLAGVSSGACLHAGLRIANELDRGDVVVMFSDGAWKYLPTRPWDAALRQDRALDDLHWW